MKIYHWIIIEHEGHCERLQAKWLLLVTCFETQPRSSTAIFTNTRQKKSEKSRLTALQQPLNWNKPNASQTVHLTLMSRHATHPNVCHANAVNGGNETLI
ncbi:hypothetical protein LSH36_15g04027 [Paralvinella palmiformis]|uniref:Uncharacterized protein n=1 Tax=Paralvinella palmiformis TaxID=53620 RepID=A0AAD9KCD8_9ANNE|nr:hypothetical protein LSH36_15g04027 [Paralvinella palmiformis]